MSLEQRKVTRHPEKSDYSQYLVKINLHFIVAMATIHLQRYARQISHVMPAPASLYFVWFAIFISHSSVPVGLPNNIRALAN